MITVEPLYSGHPLGPLLVFCLCLFQGQSTYKTIVWGHEKSYMSLLRCPYFRGPGKAGFHYNAMGLTSS